MDDSGCVETISLTRQTPELWSDHSKVAIHFHPLQMLNPVGFSTI